MSVHKNANGRTATDIDALLEKANTAVQPSERRYASASPYIYLGTAPVDTAESAETWSLTRLTVSATGVVTATATATHSWTGRASATYA